VKSVHLIAQMARENFLWGAPRIHGELLMLGFSVSQATVSRHLPAPGRRPTQSWRTFLRNQAKCIPPIFRRAVEGIRAPAWSVQLVQAQAICGCADCDGMCWVQERVWPTIARPERSKEESALRSMRSRSDTTRGCRVRRLKESAR
jgi:hypothetical protein